MERKLPRFLLTAGASGSGKTLLTCGILQALKNRGLKPAAFKCGPDYIDPMFHTKVIGTKSRNLDTFFTDEATTRELLWKNSQGCDLAVLEGVMGYYDGVGGTTTKASAYDLARVTKTPAVLIVNCKGMSVSILAYIKGFAEFRPDSYLSGVILNQMSPMLYPRVKKQIEEQLGLPVFGYVPKNEECAIESRHLGLVMPQEIEGLQKKLQNLAQLLEKTLDLDGLLRLAEQAEPRVLEEPKAASFCGKKDRTVRLGLARDEAFCFLYEDNLQLLREMGAELVPFSPVHGDALPKHLNGLLLYGGYPELFGEELEANAGLREEIKQALQNGMPVLAECGGFLYLHEVFEDMEGKPRKGVGCIPGKAFKTTKLSRFGYITLTSKSGRFFGREAGAFPAHEFHYFDSENCGDACYAQKPESSRGWDCMHCTDTMLAGFPHFYYYGNPNLAQAFIEKCKEYGRSTT